MSENNNISKSGKLLYAFSIFAIFAVLMAAGIIAFAICDKTPTIQHIADEHIDSLANGLMTYASISVGFILTEFALLMTFADNPFFKTWHKSGKFQIWQTLNLIALLSSVSVLVSSIVMLGWERLLSVVVGILAVNVISMLFVFIPLIVATTNIIKNKALNQE